jgi:hypothetical protein
MKTPFNHTIHQRNQNYLGIIGMVLTFLTIAFIACKLLLVN